MYRRAFFIETVGIAGVRLYDGTRHLFARQLANKHAHVHLDAICKAMEDSLLVHYLPYVLLYTWQYKGRCCSYFLNIMIS